MSDRVQYILLCEDLQSQVFLRRALLATGANARRIRLPQLPSDNHGVLRRYAEEVKVLRRQNANASTGLVVHIDADNKPVTERKAELARKLNDAGLAPRGAEERIALLVPKRNIESWIHGLDNTLAPTLPRPLNETESYPKLDRDQSACATAATRFAKLSAGLPSQPAPSETESLPSLLDGLIEFARLA